MKNKTEATKVTETYVRVPLGLIVRSRTNPRKTFETPDWPDFVENVRTFGVLQPGLARPLADAPGEPVGCVELVAGERRFRASQAAGLADMPLVLRDLTDAEVREIQHIENLQREDLSPLDEAQGFAEWCDALREGQGLTQEQAVAHVCAKIGKRRTHVFGRLALLKVTGPVREALAAGKLEVTKAQLIASVPVMADQEALLKMALEENWEGDRMSYRQLQRRIERDCRIKLQGAPFELNEVLDFEAQANPMLMRSCDGCPFRTGNMGLEENPYVCTQPACFRARAAFVLEREAELKGKTTVLSEKQTEKLEYDGTHVASDEVCYHDADRRTWGEILGKHKPAAKVGLLIQEGEPKVREFYDAAEALKVVKDKKLLKETPAEEETEEDRNWRAEQEQAKKEREARKELMDAARRRLIHAAALDWPVAWTGNLVAFWRKMAMTVMAATYDWDDPDFFAGRPQLQADDAEIREAKLVDYIRDQQSEPNLIGLILDMLTVGQADHGDDGAQKGQIMKIWGIDWTKKQDAAKPAKAKSDGKLPMAKGKKEKQAAKAKPAAKPAKPVKAAANGKAKKK